MSFGRRQHPPSTASAIKAANNMSQEAGPGETQRPGGNNPKPTRAPLHDRSASPANYASSGMESAMGAHADKMHPPKS